MKFYTIFRQSLKAIFANKGRSFLTILGIVIGIGSVIALISFGTGVNASISDRISALGTNNITIMPGAGFDKNTAHSEARTGAGFNMASSTLTTEDLKSLADKSKHPQIKMVSGEISGSTIINTANGDQRYTVLGTPESYIKIQNLSLSHGHFYKQGEVDNKAKVIVLGSQLAKDLYGFKDAIGQSLIIEGSAYMIIGILKPADGNGFTNPNSQAYIPYTTAAEAFKIQNFNSITVQAQDENMVDQVKKDIKTTLLSNHQIKDVKLADFNVSSSADLLSAVTSITTMLTALLAGIAAISLLVGGIGIMNIMLVSVTERTREIGLRKAVGAKTFDIMIQFIIEAILLTLSGGILGIGLGFLIGKLAAPSLGFTPIVSNSSILLAVGVSSFIGILFGVYPAAKASRLNPIEALRYE